MVTQVKLIRLQKEIPQYVLAQEVGVSESKMSKIETGRLQPTKQELSKIAKALRVKVSAIERDYQPR